MSGGYRDRWHDPADPSWVVEPTTEWHPQFPGQRYPGDLGTRHTPPPPRGRSPVIGRAEVPPLAPTRPDGTYLGRSWTDHDDRLSRPAGDRPEDEPYRPPAGEQIWRRERRQPEPDRQHGPAGFRPAPTERPREAAWHRDRGGSDRRDGWPPRPASGVTPVSPGPRPEPARGVEPGWLPEPDEVPPHRRGPHGQDGHRQPSRQPADRWPRGHHGPGHLDPRPHADGYHRPDGRSPADERRRAEERGPWHETAARSETYPDRRPREASPPGEAYREPWPRPDRDAGHRPPTSPVRPEHGRQPEQRRPVEPGPAPR
ncbi:hypothetical protein E1165_20075, partial [Micromonospora sp. KC723]